MDGITEAILAEAGEVSDGGDDNAVRAEPSENQPGGGEVSAGAGGADGAQVRGDSSEAQEATPDAPKQDDTPEQPAPADPFSDEALATKEGVLAGRDALRAELEETRKVRATHDAAYTKLINKGNKLDQKIAQYKRDRGSLDAEKAQLQANLQNMFRGSGQQVLDALVQLSGGRDAVRLVEELNTAVLGKKPRDASDPAVVQALQELRNDNQQLRTYIQQRDDQAQLQQARGALMGVARDAEKYPNLARLAQQNPHGAIEALEGVANELFQGGANTFDAIAGGACSQVENQLVQYAEQMGWSRGQPTVAGRAPSENVPGQAHGAPGQSLPAASTGGSSERELTEDERIAAAAKNPAVLRMLGM